MNAVAMAKEAVRIPDLWRARGWPGEPGRKCRVPYRDDRHPSGSIFRDGLLFHDFSTGDTFDAPALLARVEGLSSGDACRLFLTLACLPAAGAYRPASAKAKNSAKKSSATRSKPSFPDLRECTEEELCRIADLRTVDPEACLVAARRGHLFTTDWRGAPVWAITDSARWSCQVRNFGGEPFRISGGTAKAITLRGSYAGWPIGCAGVESKSRFALVEGGGDFLAAYHFALIHRCLSDVQPICLPGASLRIAAEALPLLENKRIRIFPHVDEAGASAALRWEIQLCQEGCVADCFDLSGLARSDGSPATDLNDVTDFSPDELERNGLTHMLNF